MCNLTCIFFCVPFFHVSIRVFPWLFQDKIKMIKDKVAAVEPEKGVLLKTDLQGSISKLEEVWEGHPCCKKQYRNKNGNGSVFFGSDVLVEFKWRSWKTFRMKQRNSIDLWKCLSLHHWHSSAKGAWLLVWNGWWCQTCCFDMFSWTTCGLNWSNERIIGTYIYSDGWCFVTKQMSSTNFPMGSLALREWGLWGSIFGFDNWGEVATLKHDSRPGADCWVCIWDVWASNMAHVGPRYWSTCCT